MLHLQIQPLQYILYFHQYADKLHVIELLTELYAGYAKALILSTYPFKSGSISSFTSTSMEKEFVVGKSSLTSSKW